MAKPLVQVQEWRPLVLPDGLDTPVVRQRVLRAGESEIGSAFSLRRGRLYARGLVGLVDAGPLQVQVIPKLYDDSKAGEDALMLLELLARTALPKRAAVLPSAAQLSHLPVTEPMFRHIAELLQERLLQGVPRRYTPIDELSSTLRGRVDLGRVARRHLGAQHLIPVRHAPLQQDNPLSRVLRALADRLSMMTRVGRTRASLNRSSEALHAARRSPLTRPLVEAVQLSRLEQEWEPLLDFARLLVASASQDIARGGTHSGCGLMFPLDGLFETLIRNALRHALMGTAYRLRGGKMVGRLLRRATDDREIFALKPDVLVDHYPGGGLAFVGDAKWKRLDPGRASLGLKEGDLYQILAYMRRTKATSGALFFPRGDRTQDVLRKHELEVLTGGEKLWVIEVRVESLLTRDPSERAGTDSALQALVAGIAT